MKKLLFGILGLLFSAGAIVALILLIMEGEEYLVGKAIFAIVLAGAGFFMGFFGGIRPWLKMKKLSTMGKEIIATIKRFDIQVSSNKSYDYRDKTPTIKELTNKKHFAFSITYEFQIENEMYNGYEDTDEKSEKAFLLKHREKQLIPVLYDPTKPKINIIDWGNQKLINEG